MKVADIDINLFGDHDKTDETEETIPLTPGGMGGGGVTSEPEHKQKVSFGWKNKKTRLKKTQFEGLYQKLSESIGQTPAVFHFDNFKLRDGQLYYKGKSMSLTIKGGS